MDVGILYYNPDKYTKDFFKSTYQSLAPKEYGELTKGLYGKYTTEEYADVEFALYEVADNRIGLLLISDEITRTICIEGEPKDFFNNYTQFMIITKSKDNLQAIQAYKNKDENWNYGFKQESLIFSNKKITILLEQGSSIKCTVIKGKQGKIIKTKIWDSPQQAYEQKTNQENTSNQNSSDEFDKYFEYGKDLPMIFGRQLPTKEIEKIKKLLKKYHDEQTYGSKREAIELISNPNPDSSESKSPTRIRKS